MFKKLIFVVFILSFISLFGQIGGQSSYRFLGLITSPRQAALGGKVLTFVDSDVNQAFFNPATINPDMHRHLAVNYGSLFGEVQYGTAAYAYTYDRHLQTFHAGINYVNYGSFDGRDNFGNSIGSFTGSEAALSLGYAHNIAGSDWYVGANAKLITSTLEQYQSFGGAADLGVLFIDEPNDVNWAFVVRNLGTQFTTYNGTREKLPMEILFGVSQEVENVPIRWHLTLENLQQWNIAFANPARAQGNIDGGSTPEKISFLGNAIRHVIIGAELFPQKSFNLRVGYNFRRAEELSIVEQRNFSGFSVGVGIKFNKIKFNYSYSRYTVAANTSLFGLTIDLSDNFD
ncbi:MAG: hypothetical protein RLZZ312_1622 [Bacteroidota bacterium]|jgi:hypothetical protein